jgi:acetoin utilization transport system permease protein
MLVISLMIYALVTAAGTITGNLAAQLITLSARNNMSDTP